eukprot:gb/GFBE01023476.1/.p1 GENE.gb/GFBE01023476.1/~~gb/GFBE01023476.1/.p1  ORF type:complete len:344 (+),score=66.54 gb/GFBE01023476.1/:1-1032(+)
MGRSIVGDKLPIRKTSNKFTLGDGDNEIFCVRFSPDDLYLAAACGNGLINVYNSVTGKLAFVLNAGQENRLPTTQVRWRPSQCISKTKNVLVSVGADGRILHWHASSGKCLHEIVEPDNQLFCVDYLSDGSQFATAGKRREVRIYDEYTKKLTQVMKGGDQVNTPGHSNRVFALKYHPTMRNVLVTGGWDNTVQIWDVRQGHAVRAIYGPHVCGDSLDISQDGETILTGSWRVEKQLQLWDFGSEKLLDTVPWRSTASMMQPCMVYAAQFSKDETSSMIAAGGSGSNEAQVFERTTSGGTAVFGKTFGLNRACYSVDFSNASDTLAVAGGDGVVHVMSIHGPA